MRDARTEEDITAVVRGLQSLEEFTFYPTEVQRGFAEEAFYEVYGPNRVIFKQGNHADFLYFVIKGNMIFRGVEGTSV